MIVNLTGSQQVPILVTDPRVLDALEVRCGDLTPAAADAVLRADGLGTADQEHAWLDVEALRARCAVADARWDADFDAMIRFAQSRGWTSADGRQVRAHLSR